MKPYGFKHRDITVGNNDSSKVKDIRKKKARTSNKQIIDDALIHYEEDSEYLEVLYKFYGYPDIEEILEGSPTEATQEDLDKYLTTNGSSDEE